MTKMTKIPAGVRGWVEKTMVSCYCTKAQKKFSANE